MFKDFSKKAWGPIAAILFGFAAYKVPELIMRIIAPFVLPLLPTSENIRNFVLYGTFEALAIGAVFLLLYFYGQKAAYIGLDRFKPSFIVKAGMGFCTYFVLSVVVSSVVGQFMAIPDEAQPIGFAQPNALEMVLAFTALVIVVPLAEELLFRGFLFKGLRSRFSFITTSLVVSLLFALAHGQLNVGLDVFALSLVLCYLREKTNSLWPGILLHSLKNAIAFFILFIYNGH